MNKKQTVGLIVAGLVFSFVYFVSALSSSMTRKVEKNNSILNAINKQATNFSLPITDYIGVVSVNGAIMDTETTFALDGYNHRTTMELIDAYINSPSNKAILLKVNSPGGSVYVSDEIYFKLKEYKEVTNRPIITYMEETAASGGYYIAMASDKIYANRNTITGSIGVIMQLSNYSGLAEKLGIKNIAITSGGNKDLGSPWKDLDNDQALIFQSIVDEAYEQFIGIITESRGITKEKLIPIADGRVYTSKQALDLNLIDEIANYEDVVSSLEAEYNAKLFTPKTAIFSFSSLFGITSQIKPKSEVEIFSEMINDNRNGVLMYYAY